MKDAIHRIFSVIMAIMLLLSTTAWKIEKHYCMGRLIDIALFTPAEDCGMDMEMSDSDIKSCCEDEVIVIDGQDDLKLSFNDISVEQQLFLVVFTNTYIDLFNGFTEQIVPNEQYPPPILVKDIQVFDQVFLI